MCYGFVYPFFWPLRHVGILEQNEQNYMLNAVCLKAFFETHF